MNMDYHKGLMKTSLAENLRALMVKKMFEKITIKQICDETGVIRATFYNYFDDKYDCLNWIVHMDFIGTDPHNTNTKNIIDNMLDNVVENRAFYKAGYMVTGQNNFEDMIRDNLSQMYLDVFSKERDPEFLPHLSNEFLARYFAESSAFIIKSLVYERGMSTAKEAQEIAHELAGRTISDFRTRKG